MSQYLDIKKLLSNLIKISYQRVNHDTRTYVLSNWESPTEANSQTILWIGTFQLTED